MKFLAGRSLKQIGLYSLLLMIVIFVAEYFGVRYHLHSLEEAERKIDFARSIQIGTQQIALQSQLYFQGNTQLASDITTKIEQQDHQLRVLADGGRIDGTAFFIKPLSRLPRITFDNLIESWENYKSSIEGASYSRQIHLTLRMQADSLGVNLWHSNRLSAVQGNAGSAMAFTFRLVYETHPRSRRRSRKKTTSSAPMDYLVYRT